VKIFLKNVIYFLLCGLAWRVRRPLPLENADMREAKLEGGTLVVSSSSMHYDETSSCGVVGDMVANRRVRCHIFVMDTGLGPEGSRLTMNVRRSQGSDAEEGIEGLAEGKGDNRERARTKLLTVI